MGITGLTVERDRLLARSTVSAIVSTNRRHQMRHILRTFASQQECDKQLLLLAHGFEPEWEELKAEASDMGIDELVTLEADDALTLGESFNKLVAHEDSIIISIMNDEDLFTPNYLLY